MIILKEKLYLDSKNLRTHIKIPFKLSKSADVLTINFHYLPKEVEDKELSKALLIEGLLKYSKDAVLDEDALEKFLPLKNLVTLSLDSPEKYIGAAHRHPNTQKHIISKDTSSRGFIATEIIEGEWIITVSCHYILGNVIAELEVICE